MLTMLLILVLALDNRMSVSPLCWILLAAGGVWSFTVWLIRVMKDL